MQPHPAPFRLAAPVLLAALAAAAAASPARADPLPMGGGASLADGDAARNAALPTARDRAARAAAAVEDLKRELAPGHLTDPMPEVDRTFGLAALRSDYADAQRRAAGFRATLGDRHPTLLATEEVMAGLRAQLLDGTRKALASAERDAAGARAAVAAAEHAPGATAHAAAADHAPGATAHVAAASAAVAAADATGSVAAPPRPAARTSSPLSLPPAPAERRVAAEAPQTRAAAPAHHLWSILAAGLAAAAATALLAAWAAFRLLRRPRAAPAAMPRLEPALATPAAEVAAPAVDADGADGAAPADPVPVLRRLALPRSAEALSAAFAAPGGGTTGAAELHAALRTGFGAAAAARMTVLVAPAAGLPGADADAAALALALAAAADGRRPLLMEARAAGRLRGTFVPPAAAPVLVEAAGTTRTLYRLGPAGAPVGLLPSDAGEAEAAMAAAARPGTARLRGLDAFDTIVLVGDDAATLATSADLLLLAAPAEATAEALSAAALALGGGGRACGAVLIEPAAPARAPSLPRRRPAAEATASRLGLRGSIEPHRRRVGA
ncbi:hypothetical protein D3273_15925 [Lichenibacterium minor]|uniref:Uncharacterized protein n=1 Tax=Lichenibacterium minor TaxID=2316528 RepID=A0A4Q2U3W5_9HYPH|nr:hypothetical protein [Lichenibacterium minor]RYC31022.1 hypothetical protein D3273_15925 [Lichenibacterium minor]